MKENKIMKIDKPNIIYFKGWIEYIKNRIYIENVLHRKEWKMHTIWFQSSPNSYRGQESFVFVLG